MGDKMNCEKALILARGLGTRMRREQESAEITSGQAAVAETGMKAMIPIGRPFLDYVLSGLADAGFTRVCLVIGPEHKQVREYYDRLGATRLQIEFAIQAEPRGTADAVLAGEEFAGDDEFVVMNSDNYYPIGVLRTLRELGVPGTVLFDEGELVRKSNIPAERVRAFAFCKMDAEGNLAELIEKPDASQVQEMRGERLISMNIWRFDGRIFEFCRRVERSSRGEVELPGAVRDAIRAGIKLKVIRSAEGVLDLSQRSDIAAVAERLKSIEISL